MGWRVPIRSSSCCGMYAAVRGGGHASDARREAFVLVPSKRDPPAMCDARPTCAPKSDAEPQRGLATWASLAPRACPRLLQGRLQGGRRGVACVLASVVWQAGPGKQPRRCLARLSTARRLPGCPPLSPRTATPAMVLPCHAALDVPRRGPKGRRATQSWGKAGSCLWKLMPGLTPAPKNTCQGQMARPAASRRSRWPRLL